MKPWNGPDSLGVATVKVKWLVEIGKGDVSSSADDKKVRTLEEERTSGYQCGSPGSSVKLKQEDMQK